MTAHREMGQSGCWRNRRADDRAAVPDFTVRGKEGACKRGTAIKIWKMTRSVHEPHATDGEISRERPAYRDYADTP